MAKLIRTAVECGHRHHKRCFYYEPQLRDSILSVIVNCIPIEENNFPEDCPLEEGIKIPTTIDHIIEIAKTEGLLYDVCKPGSILQTITLMEKIEIDDDPEDENEFINFGGITQY